MLLPRKPKHCVAYKGKRVSWLNQHTKKTMIGTIIEVKEFQEGNYVATIKDDVTERLMSVPLKECHSHIDKHGKPHPHSGKIGNEARYTEDGITFIRGKITEIKPSVANPGTYFATFHGEDGSCYYTELSKLKIEGKK